MKLKIILRQYDSDSMVTVNVVVDIEMLEKWHKLIDRLVNFYAGFMYGLWIIQVALYLEVYTFYDTTSHWRYKCFAKLSSCSVVKVLGLCIEDLKFKSV